MIHFRLCLHLICPGEWPSQSMCFVGENFYLLSRRIPRRLIVFKLNSLRSILHWKNGLEKWANIP